VIPLEVHGDFGEKSKFLKPCRQLFERVFGANFALKSSSAVACSTRSTMADVTFDAALAA
jgi:hypothetical protein